MSTPARHQPATERERLAIGALDRARRAHEPLELVEDGLADESLAVRERASLVAAEILPPERLLRLVASSESFSRRAAAMSALVRAGPRALPAVLRRVKGGDATTALFCIQVLGRVKAPTSVPLALEALREAALDPNILISQAAVESLGLQRDAGAVPLLLDMLSEPLELLEAHPWRTLSAVIALGDVGDRRAAPALLKLRDSELLRQTVDEALARLGVKPATPGVTGA